MTTSTNVDLVVVGTGSAAGAVAYKCRSAGWTVTVIDSRPFGVTDVLLVVPAFGVLPRHIQPNGRRCRPSPTHRSASRRQIERREVREEERTCRGEEVPHHVWAEPPCRTHPVIIKN